ncbi:hypothetical protein ADK61_24275 [Streptomyces sp. XY66]|uniref:hypothetical protein n=1 Tax=Streptomyces sp. XY66 TaxID=1415563 RepID=UPI0006AFA7CA|nr:hypothetical protein [Streptomyces sp. XY66]KOU73200.1 hypothetical protein ADK61_24275 [Streptomyces sp. XY66]
MPAGHHPEHDIQAYHDERPSITRLILEARWAYHRLTDTLEHEPDRDIVSTLRRHQLLHAGALLDVLALRTQAPDLYEAARDHGDLLRELDGLALDDLPHNGLDYLRAQYARLHHHTHGEAHRTCRATDVSPPPQRPCHRSGPRLVRQMLDTYAWANLGRTPRFPAVDVASELRQHLITRGLLLDWAATAAPSDNAAAAAAANAGHALRALDRRTALSGLRARAYLRDAFRDLDDQDEDDDPHPLDCAGHCDGTGEVLTVLTWEHHGDGIYTPVHQEPVLCFGAPTAHAPDCATCEGHGFTYTPGYRELCLDGRTSDREPAAATSASQGA